MKIRIKKKEIYTHTYKIFYTPYRKGIFWVMKICAIKKGKLVLIQMLYAF